MFVCSEQLSNNIWYLANYAHVLFNIELDWTGYIDYDQSIAM